MVIIPSTIVEKNFMLPTLMIFLLIRCMENNMAQKNTGKRGGYISRLSAIFPLNSNNNDR